MKKPVLSRFAIAKILLILTVARGLGWPVQSNDAQATPTAVPKFSHVIIIMIENKEFDQVIGNIKMPNFNRWARDYTLLARYYAVTHPSLPNYIALIGGDFFGIQSDCTDCYVEAKSLPDLIEASGRSWKTYQEGLPSAGFSGSFSGKYAKKHNPFVYFSPILQDPARCQQSIVPLTQLAVDLEKNQLPDYSFITPDLCNSSHDCSPDVTDAWLGEVVSSILQSQAFDENSLLVLTFDEGTTNQGCCGSPFLATGGRIATVLISPLVKKGSQDTTPYSHYSLLKTIAFSWGLEKLRHASDPATNLIEMPWKGKN